MAMSFDQEEFLRAVQQGDEKANEKCSPPLGEKLYIPTIFLAEVFPSSMTETLRKLVRRRRWTGESNQIFIGNDAATWLDAEMGTIHHSSWNNVGTIRKDPNYLEADAVPTCAKAIIVTIEQMVPGMVVVVAQFVLEDSISQDVNYVLGQSYASELEQRGNNRIATLDPPKVKAREYQRCISNVKSDCAKWMRSFVSGAFASMGDLTVYPSCVLMALEKEGRLSGPDRFSPFSFYSSVGFDYPYSTPKNEKMNLFLYARDTGSERIDLVLVGNASLLLSQRGDDWWQYCHHLNLQFGWNFSRWALQCYLSTAIREIGSIRVEVASAVRASTNAVRLKESESVHRRLVEVSADVTPVIETLKEFCSPTGIFFHEVSRFNTEYPDARLSSPLQFLNVPEQIDSTGRSLTEMDSEAKFTLEFFEGVREGVLRQLSFFEREEARISALTSTTATLLAARAEIDLSKSNFRLQLLVILLTIIALIVGILQIL